MSLTDLLAKVMAAPHGSMNLDVDVLEALEPDWRTTISVPDRFVTSSLDSSLALCERVLPAWFGIYVSLEFSGGADRTWASVRGSYEATLTRNPQARSAPSVTARGSTPALALLAALLRALLAQQEHTKG